MVSLPEAKAVRGLGLEGDRYALMAGTYSGKRHNLRHVTLISVADVARANSLLATPFKLEETRRNIAVGGNIELLKLIGREFAISDVRMRGVEECTPCKRPSQLSETEGFLDAFKGRAGIPATILSDGNLRIGDVIDVD